MEGIKKIPSRDQIPAEDKWAIEDLYATDDAWEADRATLEESRKTLASFAGRLGESGETLYAYLENMERVNAKAELLGNYCMRRADEDTRNAAYQGMTGKFMSTVVALGAACSFDTPEIMAISDEKLAQFCRLSQAGALPPLSDQSAPPQGAHPLRRGGKASGGGGRNVPGARHHLRLPHRRGHEVPRRRGRQGK